MNNIRRAIQRLLRGAVSSAALTKLGIDPKQYWLLVDLFGELSQRGELTDQLGRNALALHTAAWIYFAMSAVLSLTMVVVRPPISSYVLIFAGFNAFVLFMVLMSEAANSLVNPVEGPVLAHQPIKDATYTAAKLTHLALIVLYLSPATNVLPALAGLTIKQANWTYPVFHLVGALVLGFLAALFCCALYGWLLRFVPASRLKAAGQLASTIPLLGMMFAGPIAGYVRRSGLLQWMRTPKIGWALATVGGLAMVAVVVLGLRALSADYLVRVSAIARSGGRSAKPRRSLLGVLVARYFGGQPARAGFAFVSRMMRRDWQFRRQVLPLFIYLAIMVGPLLAKASRVDPFSGQLTAAHVLPHLFGILLFFVCNVLVYSADYKGAVIFLSAPAGNFTRFARGVHALLWIEAVVIPHLLLLLFLGWRWGWWHAGLFTAYSLATASFYLALTLRRIEGVPFSKQMDPSASALLLPLMLAGAVLMAMAVGLQYYVVFRSPVVTAAATAVIAIAAFFLTRKSVNAFAVAIRFHLGLLADEGSLYKEVGV